MFSEQQVDVTDVYQELHWYVYVDLIQAVQCFVVDENA